MVGFDQPGSPGTRWRRRAALLCVLLGTAGLVVAAMRPHSGGPPAKRRGVVELVLDASRSMAVGDVAPSRVGALQRATLRFLGQLPKGAQVGVVAVSDRPLTLVRPTTDRQAVRDAVTRLHANGSTLIAAALRRALGDLAAAGAAPAPADGQQRAVPTALLLVSDGGNTYGSGSEGGDRAEGASDPLPVARAAAARHIPIHTITLGSRTGALKVRIEESGLAREVPLPSDPGLMSQIARLAGGRSAEARSASELDRAYRDLGTRIGLISDYRDLTLLLLAVALLPLAAAALLWPSRRAASGPDAAGPGALARRWLAPALLVLAAGGALLSWAVLTPARALPQAAAFEAPPPGPLTAPFVEVGSGASKADREVADEAVALLRRHGELATQRRADAQRLRLQVVGQIRVEECGFCDDDELASTASNPGVPGFGKAVDCVISVNWGALRQEARTRSVSMAELTALALAHGQEHCLVGDPDRHQPPAVPAELRLARELGTPRLFEVSFVHLKGSGQDLGVVERAAGILMEQGQLAPQRRADIRRQRLNELTRLSVTVCRGCLKDLLGQSYVSESSVGQPIGCGIDLDVSALQGDARTWGLSLVEVTASTLIHEQEHCIRDPDDRETPSIDMEVRLARKLGDPRLVEYANSSYALLDSSGHWKDLPR